VLRALIHDPEVVFADEPCNSLDPYNAKKFRSLLQTWLAAGNRLGKERTLILVTHNAQEAWEVANYFVLIEQYGLRTLIAEPKATFHNSSEIEERIRNSGINL
jgi:ABC-type molybdenum transport system ATPase subunit/photorepair protein PhrA